MFWNFMLMQIRPCLFWVKLYLWLFFPVIVYLQNPTGIIAVLTTMVILVLIPRASVLSRVDFSYHMIRGLFLELTGEVTHHSRLYQILLGSMIMKLIISIIYSGLYICSIYLLWNQNLLVGALLFYGLISCEMCIASTYSNISKNNITNEKWDILISNDKK